MAFLPSIGVGTKKFQTPAMTPYPELQPQMLTPNQGRRANVITSNANASSPQTNSKPAGRRAGGRAKRDTTSKAPTNRYSVIPTRMSDKGGSKSSLNITPSDFGFDIQGANSPTPYQGKRDTTLFRDYNQKSIITKSDKVISTNAISNSIKCLNVDLKQSLQYYFDEAWVVIKNDIARDIVSNTRAAKGAMDVLDDITGYFDKVIRAYDLLIELEVMQAWTPSSNDYYDRSFRALAVAVSTPLILEYRAKLRQALIPHVLPLDWMMYIKWLRETKLSNGTPESTKLRFNSLEGVSLIDAAFTSTPLTKWTDKVESTITALNNTNVAIPATLINNVNCVNLKNVKEYYTGVHNSAVYDPDFNDIFNNRVYMWDTGKLVNQYPLLTGSTPCYAAFHTDTPYAMALAALFRQHSQGGLPLEGSAALAKVSGETTLFNSFRISETGSFAHEIKGVDNWDEYRDDSTHVVDLALDGTLVKAMSSPKGENTLAFSADYSNIAMAARESLMALTLASY